MRRGRVTEMVARSKTGRGYRKLLAFQAAHELVKAIYQTTAVFPKMEQFGLVSQMRRAAVSVAANIVEGHALNTTPQFLRHLATSFGSCKELEYYIDLAHELEYIEEDRFLALQQLEGRTAFMISRLSTSLRNRLASGTIKKSAPPASRHTPDSADSPVPPDSLDSINRVSP